MPKAPRRPLGPISANINTRGPELKPYQRARIIGAHDSGCSQVEIAALYSVPRTTVQYTVEANLDRHEAESQYRKGRPNIFTDREERHILRLVRANPKWTYTQLKAAAGVYFSHKTIYRILSDHGITNWRAKRRPFLTAEHAKKRLSWAEAYIDWPVSKWALVHWSDECSVERGSGKDRVWVFRTPQQKWTKDMIETYKKGGDHSVMVWGGFSGRYGQSELHIMKRDEQSKRGGYSANSYIITLEKLWETFWEPDMIFMQDNAPIHTAKKVEKWFKNRGVEVMDWPPYSPDLNPQEHLWPPLKKSVYAINPDIEKVTGGQEKVQDALGDALVVGYRTIPRSLIDELVESMPRRCAAVIAAEGWYTKY